MPKNCSICGKLNNDKAKFCNGCGTPFVAGADATVAVPKPKQSSVPQMTQIPQMQPVNVGAPAVPAAPAAPAQTVAPSVSVKQSSRNFNIPKAPIQFMQAPENLIACILSGNVKEAKGHLSSIMLKDNMVDRFGNNMLHISAGIGNAEMVAAVLDAGASLDTGNNLNETALAIAADHGDLATVSLLLDRGADPNLEDATGISPIDLAIRQNSSDMVRLLAAKGADINKADSLGWTPLHRAAFLGHSASLAALIELGADVNSKDFTNKTPLYYARKEHQDDTCSILAGKGAAV